MPQLLRGQKIKLADLTPSLQLRAGIGAQGSSLSFDISCFGVDESGKLSDDRYFVFFNQKNSPEGAIKMLGAQSGDTETFAVDLAKLPSSIKKLVFALTIDGAGEMRALQSGYFRLDAGGQEIARFPFAGRDFQSEKAVMLAEIYRKDVWRLAAVGQGFAGGLSALLKNFGGEELAAPTPTPVPSRATPPPARATPPPAPPLQPRVAPPLQPRTPPPLQPRATPPTVAPTSAPNANPGQTALERRGDKTAIPLRGGSQPIRVNLKWQAPPPKRGLLASLAGSSELDLDLGCFYRLKSGQVGIVQQPGEMYGSQYSAPFIFIGQDDRSGAARDGENLTLCQPDQIDFVLLFAMIYEGASDFLPVNARVSLCDSNGVSIALPLASPERNLGFCALASLRAPQGNLEITKEELYFKGHREADRHFGFGFRYDSGAE